MASNLIKELNNTEVEQGNYHKLKLFLSRLQTEKEYYKPETDRKEYEGDHEIMKRPPKYVKERQSDGVERTVVKEQNKLVFNFQQKIVETALSFLFGTNSGIQRDGEVDEKAFEGFESVWDNLKMDHRLEEAIRSCMVETKSALLMYLSVSEKTDNTAFKDIKNRGEFDLNVKVLNKENGDYIYPHWDEDGNLDALTRIYNVPDYSMDNFNLDNPKSIEKVEIYTQDYTWHIWKRTSGWETIRNENEMGKIPVVYFEKKYPEWHDVKTLIKRLELLNSKHSDTNDYFAFPALIVKGEVSNLPDKEEVGKMFEISGDEDDQGNVTYNGGVETLTWDQSPQSVKDEYEKLVNAIYSMTNTPDISFENLKGAGSVSGIALKLMFLDADVKARNNKMLYGEGIQRLINLMKLFIGKVVGSQRNSDYLKLKIGYKFDSIIPESDSDLIDNLMASVGNKPIMSQKTAAEQHPYVNDAEQEIKNIKDEEPEEPILPAGSLNP